MRYQRTIAALVLTAAAVAVPCTAWWVAGNRAVERERRELLAGPALAAERTAARLAERVTGRLEAVLVTESRRPFYEYRHRYPDLSEECACAPIIESPLARGPGDRVIATHFEVDRNGRISLPALPEDPDEAADPRFDAARATLAKLNRARPALVRTVWENGRPPRPEFSRSASPPLPDPAGGIVVAAESAGGTDAAGEHEAGEHAAGEHAAWESGAGAAPAVRPGGRGSSEGGAVRYGETVAWVHPFTWHTVAIDGRPALVAVRPVRAPEGSLLQGFVIDTGAVEASLGAEDGSVRLGPVVAAGSAEADGRTGGSRAWAMGKIGLGETTWAITADASGSLREAELRAADLSRGFRRLFFGGSGVAVLAAVFVVGLVGQTERLARERSRFAATAAHELRTPLAGMRVYGEMISEGLGDREKTRRYARQVASEADRLARVVSNVLEYTRLEGGTSKLAPRPGDLGGCVRECVERLRPALELAGASLRLRVTDALPTVRFDPDAVQQILQNLLDNAERYARESVDRTIRVDVEPAGSDEVRVSVADRGPGIPARDRTRLFRPFTRGSKPDAPAGLGLGLALVGSLAKAQGATVRYRSGPGGGSIFEISFPV